jgi:regulator of cell morphogenesis and NO signaling
MINLTTTLAELVSRNERYAPVLERAGLDYCCGGQRSLGEAADEAGLDGSVLLGDLLRAVEPAAPGPEWVALGTAELCDHITTTHHTFLRERLPELLALAEKVEGVHGRRHPELTEVHRALQVLWSELLPHLAAEETDLFPVVRAGGTLDPEVIEALGDDHEVVGALLETVRALTSGFQPPQDGCASYRSLYTGLAELDRDVRLHVHKENNVLFPALTSGAPPEGE